MLAPEPEPLITADWQGVAKFFLLYGAVIISAVLSIRKWIIQPTNAKYESVVEALDDAKAQATREHNEIYKEIDRRIGLEPGMSVKTMADGLGGRIAGVEVEVGRLELMADKVESAIQSNHNEQMNAMLRVSEQVAGLNATVRILVDTQMQRIGRVADHLEGR